MCLASQFLTFQQTTSLTDHPPNEACQPSQVCPQLYPKKLGVYKEVNSERENTHKDERQNRTGL